MKKKLFTLLALLMTVIGASAQESTKSYFVELTAASRPDGTSFTMTYQLGSAEAVDVSNGINSGEVSVPAGAIVTLTVTPAQGYVAGTVTGETFMEGSEMRTRGNDPVISIFGDVEITQSTTNPNVFTYTQPTANVRLTVSYLKIDTPDNPDNPEPVVEETPTEDGGTITTTTTTEKLEDGTVKETRVEEKKDVDGNVESVSETIKETKTEDDGSSVESTQTTKTDGDGNFVSSETIEEKKDAEGNVEKTTTQAEVPEVSGDAIAMKDEATGKEENYYPASKETQEKLDNIVSADVAFEENSVQNIQVVEMTKAKVTKYGVKSELKSYRLNSPKSGEDSKMSLLGQKNGQVLKSAVDKGKLLGYKKDLVKVWKRNTRGEGDADDNMIELESGEEYEIQQDGDLVLTLKTSESDVEIESISVSEATGESETITIGSKGKATFTGKKSLDFSFSDEVKAYVATGIDKESGTIWLTRVKDVPADVPVMIKGVADKTYNVPVKEGKNSCYENMFVGNTSGESITIAETSDDGTKTNYYMSGGQFVSVKGNAKIGDGKCYLQLPTTLPAAAPGANQPVTIAATGKSSYAAPVDLDFTNVEGLKAFTATGYDRSSKTIWLTRVMKAQKGEGLLLKGDANQTYNIPSSGVQSGYGNMFVGNTSGDKITIYATNDDGSLTNFYLWKGQFVSVNGNATIGNNKCYLQLPTEMVSAGASTRSVEFDYNLEEPEVISMPIVIKSLTDADGTTGIDEVVKYAPQSDDAFYNLQGQRVDNPGKGLYIRNGKKVVIR